jgi:flagellar motility protein MotE (MotC chaperone)
VALLLLPVVLLSVGVTPAKSQGRPQSLETREMIEAKARLLQELDLQIEERRRELAREEQSLAALQRAIQAATADLVEERKRLETLQGELEADMQRRQVLVDERLGQIAQMYAAMKPKEAAQALEGMDDDMAVAILERLPGRSVGKLFDVMPKDRVRQLTLRLEEGRAKTGE